MWRNRLNNVTFVTVAFLTLLFALTVGLYIFRAPKYNSNYKMVVDWELPEYGGNYRKRYMEKFDKVKFEDYTPEGGIAKLPEESAEVKFDEVRSNTELIDLYGISFKDGTLSDLAIEANSKLFDVCSRYYLVSYNHTPASPIYPMAIANIETGFRADQDVTYSSLYPSAILPFNGAADIDNMSSLQVLQSAEVFNKLAKDHWTRDRGPFQMNPDYGITYDSFNSLMGPSEETVLSGVTGNFTGYATSEARTGGTITAESWLGWLSQHPGDRHNPKDAVLRLAAANTKAVEQIGQTYSIDSEPMFVVMMAQYHGNSSIWTASGYSKTMGNWRSGYMAYSYALDVGSQEFYTIIKDLAISNLNEARKTGSRIPLTIEDAEVQNVIWPKAEAAGIVKDYGAYINEGRYYQITYCYPVRALYAYIMLSLLYSGN